MEKKFRLLFIMGVIMAISANMSYLQTDITRYIEETWQHSSSYHSFRHYMNDDMAVGLQDELEDRNSDYRFTVMVYKSVSGWNYHYISGWFGRKFRYRGKCAVAYYHPKSEGVGSAPYGLRSKARILSNYKDHAREACEELKLYMSDRNIAYRNVGCWRRYIDLYYSGYSSIWQVGTELTIFVQLY